MREKLIYYPTVTREPYVSQGRLIHLIDNGKLFKDIALAPLDSSTDRVMICGNPEILSDVRTLLDVCGFNVSPSIGRPGDYVYEPAFSEK
jgi:ferredoxin--NADP+ reductase